MSQWPEVGGHSEPVGSVNVSLDEETARWARVDAARSACEPLVFRGRDLETVPAALLAPVAFHPEARRLRWATPRAGEQFEATSAARLLRLRGCSHEISPRRCLSELTLKLKEATVSAVRGLVDEHHRADLLFSYNLEPRHRVLLSGPPGNGKTSLAEALASEAVLPLCTARYERIVSSFLGESASRLDAVFAFARQRRCVLFFDEFDTIAKERADEHETGEIKRLVSTLLLQIDGLPCHVIVVVATNHQELLDRAAWRRFQLRLRLDAPTRASAVEFLQGMQARHPSRPR